MAVPAIPLDMKRPNHKAYEGFGAMKCGMVKDVFRNAWSQKQVTVGATNKTKRRETIAAI